jgi:hypothetical protein
MHNAFYNVHDAKINKYVEKHIIQPFFLHFYENNPQIREGPDAIGSK